MNASPESLTTLLSQALSPLALDAPIAVALSGGADSVALALVAAFLSCSSRLNGRGGCLGQPVTGVFARVTSTVAGATRAR